MHLMNHAVTETRRISPLGEASTRRTSAVSDSARTYNFRTTLPPQSPLAPAHFKVSESRTERKQAFRLVHRVYQQAGLTADNPHQLRVMKHHLADTTEVLVAKVLDRVTFTATLVRDGEYGLPLESLFRNEVAAMRAAGLRLAEVSCLASGLEDLNSNHRFSTLVSMISLLMQTARRRSVDRLVLAVHPRHAKVYQRLFGCVPCSEVKEYAAVAGNPAVMCVHDFATLDRTRYPLFDKIYDPVYAPWQLDGARMSDSERNFLSKIVQTSESFLPMAA